MTFTKAWGRRILGAMGAAALFALAQQIGHAQGLACNSRDLNGRWRAQVMTDAPWDVTVDLVFQFQPDGSYSYSAGQGSFQWTSHRGTYAIGRNTGESSRSYPCLVRLTPDRETVKNNPQNKLGLMPLQARSLMDDQERTFRIQPLGPRLVLHHTDLNWRDVGMFTIERDGN